MRLMALLGCHCSVFCVSYSHHRHSRKSKEQQDLALQGQQDKIQATEWISEKALSYSEIYRRWDVDYHHLQVPQNGLLALNCYPELVTG